MEMTVIRASSLPELFDCPARWEAKHLCGRRLPRSAAAQLGTAVHAGAAVFDVQRILGSPITPDDAAGEVVYHYDFSYAAVFWFGASIISFLLPLLNWGRRKAEF